MNICGEIFMQIIQTSKRKKAALRALSILGKAKPAAYKTAHYSRVFHNLNVIRGEISQLQKKRTSEYLKSLNKD